MKLPPLPPTLSTLFQRFRQSMPSRSNVIFTLLVAAGLVIYVQRVSALAQLTTEAPTATSTTTFPYEGRLGDANGDPVTGSYEMTFNLFNVDTGGTPLWTEAWTGTNAVQVNEGLFSVLLGNLTPLPENVIVGNTSLWLGVTVGTDSEMTPRVQLGSVPYAVSALNVPDYQPYVPLYRPQTLDLTAVDASLKGFTGGFTDGRYGYFPPWYNGAYFGKVVRVDLQNFNSGGVTSLDLTTIDADLKGFTGGFSDGRYGYFVPTAKASNTYFGKLVRVDLQNFTSNGVTVLDLTTVDLGLKGFTGGFTDGRFGYLVPFINSTGIYAGKAVRVDLQNFTSNGVTVLDLTTIDVDLKGFRGGFTDGNFGYLVPYSNGTNTPFGKVVRIDLQNFTPGGVTILDLTMVSTDLKGFSGGFTDGRYGYLIPLQNASNAQFGKVVRIDLENFTINGVAVVDLTLVDAGLKGFEGGFTDGKFGYLVPYANAPNTYLGKIVRIDLQNFSPDGVTILDLTTVDPNLKGFFGGFSDGHFGYLTPHYNGSGWSGKIARIQLFFGGGSP